MCKKVEQELLKQFGETNQKYRTKYRSLIFNLKDTNNKVSTRSFRREPKS